MQELVIIGAALVAVVVIIVAIVVLMGRTKRETANLIEAQNDVFADRIGGLLQAHGEVTGYIQTLSNRLDGFGVTLNQSISETGAATRENLARLAERMSVIDKADQTIAALSGQVGELQKILGNKQSRGLFGQRGMEAIIRDALPPGSFTLQMTLSNNTRPDCVVHFPNREPGLVIDAKFPLEAWESIRKAENAERESTAKAQFRRDLLTHIKKIHSSYLIPGETQPTALMFIPSESIYADIQENFDAVIQQGYRDGVMVVSPTVLMLAVQAVQSVLKDALVREQVHKIRAEVGLLGQDVGRLDERVRKLKGHFGAVVGDVDQILISTEKVVRRTEKIDDLDLPEVAAAPPAEVVRELPFNQLEEV